MARHIRASKALEIQVEARAGDVMAGGGGAAWPAQDVQHPSQPAGDISIQVYIQKLSIGYI